MLAPIHIPRPRRVLDSSALAIVRAAVGDASTLHSRVTGLDTTRAAGTESG